MEATKPCSACATAIHSLATKCPHCRARQADAPPMHRAVPGKLIAGVCAAIAAQLAVDPTVVRVAFAVATALSAGLVFWVYVMFWLITPAAPAAVAPINRAMDWVTELFSPRRGTPSPEPRR